MAMANVFRAVREFGVIETARKLHMLKTLKFGQLVGIDELGNRYYENTEDYAYGQHRWIEYDGFRHYYSVDASEVPPQWHAWLHSITDTPPTSASVGDAHTRPTKSNSTGADTPFDRNLGGVHRAWEVNGSSMRPRGFGVTNGYDKDSPLHSAPNEEHFWTQPGNILDSRHRHPKADVGYTLADTAEDVARRRLDGVRAGSAASIAEAATRQLAGEPGEDAGPPTFALPVDDTAAAEAAAEDDRREAFAPVSERDLAPLRAQVEKLEAIVARAEALAGFSGDADAGLEDARDQLDSARAMLRAAEAVA
mmetsp:Transcript_21407/g.50333  ORF Transcript_21407/g.50333 Transcript_21407/m.50333 type:complete len:308 (-) Transcript_21407:37-960(-)